MTPGVLARFAETDALLRAVAALPEEALSGVRCFSPMPVDALDALLPAPRDRITPAVFAGALCGGLGTLLLQAWSAGLAYPLNIGGRPPIAWPLFVPGALEMTFLGAGLFGFIAWLLACRLPRLHDPVFDLPGIEAASRDGFVLFVPGSAQHQPALAEALAGAGATSITRYPA